MTLTYLGDATAINKLVGGSDWPLWKLQMEASLSSQSLWPIIKQFEDTWTYSNGIA